jgi:hypothetical protein
MANIQEMERAVQAEQQSDTGNETIRMLLSVPEIKLIAAYRDPAAWYAAQSSKVKLLTRLWLATGDDRLGRYVLAELLGEDLEDRISIVTPEGSNQFGLQVA